MNALFYCNKNPPYLNVEVGGVNVAKIHHYAPLWYLMIEKTIIIHLQMKHQ